MKKIDFFSAIRQDAPIIGEIKYEINSVINSGNFVAGEYTEQFEQEYAQTNDVKYCAAVSNGTSALTIMFRALGLKDKGILVPSNSFVASASSIVLAGAIPYFVDTADNCLMDLDKVEHALKTKPIHAVLLVNLYGNIIDLDKLVDICNKNNVILLSDCAQNAWGKYKNKSVAHYVRCSAQSCYSTKGLGGFGEAGVILTNDENIYNQALSLRNHGRNTTENYFHEIISGNDRLSNLQIAVLKTKNKYREIYISSRREVAKKYTELFIDAGLENILLKWNKGEEFRHVPYLFPIFTERRDELKKFLGENGIQTNAHYNIPIHLQPCFRYLGYKEGCKELTNTEKQAAQTLSLPYYANIPDSHVEQTVEKVIDFFSKKLYNI